MNHTICIMDGALGTYYQQCFSTNEQPEYANTNYPERIRQIHKEYIEAGAMAIRTNTFATNQASLHLSKEELHVNRKAAFELANENKVTVFCDIGPIPMQDPTQIEAVKQEYVDIVNDFLKMGGTHFLFETMSDISMIEPALKTLKENDAFVMVNFHVDQFGYSSTGLSLRHLVKEANDLEVDCVGCNCGIGPTHMKQVLNKLSGCQSALPNAGYPKRIDNKTIFKEDKSQYFADACVELVDLGIQYIGGCCGTTPAMIGALATRLKSYTVSRHEQPKVEEYSEATVHNHAFWNKDKEKLIAVELAPPFDTDDTKLMEAAHRLQNAGVDVLTFPDSPSGRTRIDPVLMAEKVYRETKLCVMPHICCRDKNASALRSQFLGAKINDIHNFLIITGDPVNVQERDSVKSVFQFDSVHLMDVVKNMNEEILASDPIYYCGAINQNRLNLDVEISRVKKKMASGAQYFLTQPVFSQESVDRLKRIYEETGAKILCGIMPLVSRRNAQFMSNEISGIDVPEEVILRYPEKGSRKDGERVGVEVSKEMMEKTRDFVAGYYFSFPFNRVYLLEEIL